MRKKTTTTTEGSEPPLDPGFALDGFEIRRLGPEDAEEVQRLYERCTDFHELAEGMPTRVLPSSLFSLPKGLIPDGECELYFIGT